MNRIEHMEEVAPNVHKMVIDAPAIAAKARPGQFVIIMPDEVGERVPFTLSDWDAEKGTITIYFLELGISTMKMAQKSAGGTIHALVGPLGKPATIDRFGKCVLAGGCFGIGGIYPIAKALKEAGNEVTCMIEARSSYLLYNQEALRSVSDELILSTTDGSVGVKGKVAAALDVFHGEGRKADMYYIVGCPFMMMRCSQSTPEDAKTFVALSALMVDGTGMCGCCRVSVGGKTQFVCVDGPEFDGKKVDWDEMFNRSSVYNREEVMAYHHHTCKALKREGV